MHNAGLYIQNDHPTLRHRILSKALFFAFLLLIPAQLAWALGTPNLLSPSSGTISDTTPTFQWTAVSGATRYRLAVQYQDSAGSYDYWYEVVVQGGSSTSYTTNAAQALEPGINYRFTVRAETSSQIGTWAGATYFHIPLGIPSGTDPDAGAISDPTPTFRWTSVPGATRYRLAVQYQDSAGSYDYWYEVVVQGGSSTSYTTNAAQALEPGINYRFTVRAETQFQVGTWATQTYFHIPLGTPSGTDPDAGAISDRTPTFRWTSVPGATRYRLAVQYQDSPGSYDYWYEVVVQGGSSTSYTTTSAQILDPGINYRFTVRAETQYQIGTWATQTHFHIPLAVPSLQQPSPGAKLDDTTPNFSWGQVTGADRYRLRVQFETSPGNWTDHFQTVVHGRTNTSYNTPSSQALHAGLNYRYDVRAETAFQNGGWSATRPFTIRPGVPNKQTPLTSTVDISRPQFSWSAVPYATHYRLNVRVHGSNALHFEQVLTGQQATSYLPPTHRALQADETYRWTVRAESNGTDGHWASAHVFTYTPPAALDAPTQLTPDEPTSDPTPLFEWQAVSNADTYEVEIYQGTQRVDHRTGLTTAQYQLLNPLSLDDYTWRVRAHNAQTQGPWSASVSFSVISANTTELLTSGLVVHTERPSLSLPGGGSLAQATLRRYGLASGALGSPLAADLSADDTVLTPQADLVEHDVYAVTVGGVDYVLTFDTSQYTDHVNLVAFGARPLAPLSNPHLAFDNHKAFEDAIQVLGKRPVSRVLFVPRGRWMVGVQSNGQPGQIQPSPNMTIRGVSRDNTLLVAPTLTLGNGVWGTALIGDDTRRLDDVEISHLTISGLYQDPVTPIPGHGSNFPYWPQSSGVSIAGDRLHAHDLGLRYLRYGVEVGKTAFGDSHDAVVDHNVIRYSNKGVHLVTTRGTQVSYNDIASIDTQGVLFVGQCFDAKVIDNDLVATQHRGLHLGKLNGGVILRNTILLGDSQYAADRMSAGILANGSNLVIMHNTVVGTDSGGLPNRYQTIGGGGIKLENGPADVLMAHNTLSNTETDGITLSAKNSNIAAVKNTISGSRQRGIRIRAGSYSDRGCPEIQPSPFPGRSTAIDQVFLVDNTISDTLGTYDLSYLPLFPMNPMPTCPTLQAYEYNLTLNDPSTWPGDLAGHNVFDVSQGAGSATDAETWGSEVASGSTGRDIAIFQNPYYADDSMVADNGALVPDDPSNIFVAYQDSPSIMLDSVATAVSFHAPSAFIGQDGEKNNTTATIHRILEDGTIDPQFLPDFGQNRFPELVNLLVTLRTTWEMNFGVPAIGTLERASYDALNALIAEYGSL